MQVIIDGRRAHIKQRLEAVGVVIVPHGASIHLQRGQRTVRVDDLLHLGHDDMAALGVVKRPVSGRWQEPRNG